MPYITADVEPEVFIEHNGLKVYHTYKNDCIDEGAKSYWFTTDPEGVESDDWCRFDVRSLATPAAAGFDRHPPFQSSDEFLSAPPERQEEIRQAWSEWHTVGEPSVIAAVIKEAIEMGLLPLSDQAL